MSSEDLAKKQKARFVSTVSSLTRAMSVIDDEIRATGYYPQNKGRVNIAEVCRRAGVSPSTLKNERHHSTRKKISEWLVILSGRAPVAKADAEALRRSRSKELIEEVKLIAGNYNLFKIKYDAAIQTLGDAEGKLNSSEESIRRLNNDIREAKRKILELEAALSSSLGTNVVAFPTVQPQVPPER